MSAKTRQATLDRLANLHATAVSLIGSGKRNQKMVDLLLKALQLFKEGKLGLIEQNESPRAQHLRRKQRIEFYTQYVKPWLEEKSSIAFPEICFNFSRRIRATLFLGKLSKLPILLQMPEGQFSSLPDSQAVLAEIRKKVAPFGLHFGMSREEVEEAFGHPLNQYLDGY